MKKILGGLPDRLERVREQVYEAAGQSGRSPDLVHILPVTKTLPASAVRAAIAAGLSAVGENRVQEAVSKMAEIDAPVRWELIGHLQSNKARLATAHFDRIQSIDSIKRIDQVSRYASDAGKSLAILLQVNTSRDPAKHGADPDEAPHLLERALTRTNIKVEGMMTIAPLSDDRAAARHAFARLRLCRDRLEQQFGCALPELSMGMSGDFEDAVREGSTLLRLGSVLFDPRDLPPQ